MSRQAAWWVCALVIVTAAGGRAAHASTNGLAITPPLGWSSWTSMRAEVNEEAIREVARIQASELRDHGYVYVNVDGGWYLHPDAGVDAYGRWVADPAKFPGGMAELGHYIHSLGLKFGLYVTPGIPALAVARQTPIENTPYNAADIAITTRTQITYLGGTMYYIDYAAPGSQEFINSWADQFASWGVDYLKLDAVGDWNIADVRAWSLALRQTGRPIHLELSNSLNPASAGIWQEYANGWRISGDIESYNGVTLTDWGHVLDRFLLAPRWLGSGGSGGWNDLDSLVVGSPNTGLTPDESRTMVTLWALAASPLIIGDDLRSLDDNGRTLLTNDEVIGINQHGVVAAPVNAAVPQQVWVALQPDGSYAVGLFNLAPTPAVVQALWSDLGFAGTASVRDVWARVDLGSYGEGFSVQLEPHGSMLLRVRPAAVVRQMAASSGSVAGWAALKSSPVGPRGQRAQFAGGLPGALLLPNIHVAAGGTYDITITYVNGDAGARHALLAVNGQVSWVAFPSSGGWGDQAAIRGITAAASLAPGSNGIAIWNPFGWAPDVVAVTLQPRAQAGPPLFRLMSAATSKFADIAFGSTAPATPIVQWFNSASPSQSWRMVSNGRGQYYFVNRFTDQAMDVLAATDEPGTALVQRPPTDSATQQWIAVATGTGAFVLVNRASRLVVQASAEWGGFKIHQSLPVADSSDAWMIIPVM